MAESTERTATSMFFVNFAIILVNLMVITFAMTLPLECQKTIGQTTKPEREIDLEPIFSNGPVTLLTTREFPTDDSFMFVNGEEIVVTHEKVTKATHAPATRALSLSLDADFSITLYYSQKDDIRMHELVLVKGHDMHFDLNGDGRFDLLTMHSKESGTIGKVLYQDQWQQISPQPKWNIYRHQLSDGRLVEFDRENGNWELAGASAPQ